MAIAVCRQRNAGHVLHDKERTTVGRSPGVEHPGDILVLHQGEGLALGFESCDHFLRIHAELEDLERSTAAERALLLTQEDLTHSSFANELEQPVLANALQNRRGGQSSNRYRHAQQTGRTRPLKGTVG